MFLRARATAAALALSVLLAGIVVPACRGGPGAGGFSRQYEYEQDIYLDLDGSATIIVNASIPALVALNGLDLPVESRARIDRDAVRRAFESPVTHVTRVSRPWRRKGRRFVQVRLEVADIRQISKAAPFSDVTYELTAEDTRRTVRGRVAGGKGDPIPEARWDGTELVAYKLHLPSRIYYHNVRDFLTGQTGSVERGNILRWEQPLKDRLEGKPIEMEIRMDQESILNRTLWLFAGSFAAAMVLLGGVILMTIRRGRNARGRDTEHAERPVA